eukprot:CAMPEP_0198732568 /NCGR_PEP_ID=MMETSP1475-20131203/36723_1 /TAXON_ID= ORGANISM="Unidentified sp., Strain CCMP1999" /NCGR_SAMPLE_ID=MMETSP1475 /ASSEMBLY_ACC=CAM_ASM_001111 /LENGTH=631 /DNA_ID=CAMNT_0044495707 /DNA_START=342 /DNA_END=2237 /DNA_ORIENTATION=+
MSGWMSPGGKSPELTYVEETVTENVTPPQGSAVIGGGLGGPMGVRFWLPPSVATKNKSSSMERSRTLPAKAASLEEFYGPDFLTLRGAKDEDENGWFSYAVGAALEASRKDVEEENLRLSPQRIPEQEPTSPHGQRNSFGEDEAPRDLTSSWRRSSPPESRLPPANRAVGSPPSPVLGWQDQGMRRHRSYSGALRKQLTEVSKVQEPDILRGLDLSPVGDLRTLSPPPNATRQVVVRNLRPSVDNGALKLVLERFGPLQDFQRQTGNQSMAIATYFDVRHAYGAIRQLHGRNMFGSFVDLSFGAHDASPTSTYSDVKEAEKAFLRSLKNADSLTGNRSERVNFQDTKDSLSKEFGGVEFEIIPAQPRPVMARGMSLPRTFFGDDSVSGPCGNGGVIGSPLETSPLSAHLSARQSPPPFAAAMSSGRSMSASWNQSPTSNQTRSKFVLDLDKVRSGEERRTALMVRNIPNKYNQKMLLQTIEEQHRGNFDFFYLPIDFKNKCNVGYAFINFTSPKYIIPFYEEFHGCKWGKFNSEKICEIAFARIQGRANLVAHFQNSSLMNEDPKCRPVLFSKDGEPEEFPVGPHVRMRRGPSAREMKALDRANSCGPPSKFERSSTQTGVPPPYRRAQGT